MDNVTPRTDADRGIRVTGVMSPASSPDSKQRQSSVSQRDRISQNRPNIARRQREQDDWGEGGNPYETIPSRFKTAQAARSTTGQLQQNKDIRPAPTRPPARSRTYSHDGQYRPTITYGPTPRGRLGRRTFRKISRHKSKTAVRVKSLRTSTLLASWVWTWYFTFQLPFAVISLIGLGLVAAVAREIDRWVPEAVVETTGRIIGWVVNPLELVLLLYTTVALFSLLMHLIMWGCYTVSGVRSLSGQSADAKQGAFVLGIFGLLIPAVNLLPLTIVWIKIVNAKPN